MSRTLGLQVAKFNAELTCVCGFSVTVVDVKQMHIMREHMDECKHWQAVPSEKKAEILGVESA